MVQFHTWRNITARFFNSHNIFKIIVQADHRFRQHSGYGSARYIIQYDRLIRSFCQRFEMLVNAFLRRFVIIRCNTEDAIYTIHRVNLQGIQQCLCAVVAYTYYQGYPFPGMIQYEVKHVLLLLFGECRGFGCCTQRNEEVNTTFDRGIDDFPQSRKINGIIAFEWSNERYPCTVEHCRELYNG